MSTLPKTRPNYRRQPDDPRRINGASHLGGILVHPAVQDPMT
jgi:hypothetical protein